jgi:hypothetical protein
MDAGYAIEQSGFSRPIAPNDGDKFTLGNRQVNRPFLALLLLPPLPDKTSLLHRPQAFFNDW